MSQDSNFDLATWWNGISFDGKDLFTLQEDGRLLLHAGKDGQERLIAEINESNADTALAPLQEKFAHLQTRVDELAPEWQAATDKLKLADKVHSLLHSLRSSAAVGNVDKLIAQVNEWETAVNAVYEENYAAKLKVAEEAEALAESTDWKETTNSFRAIIDKWKAAGHTDKSRSDKLWARIEAARTKFNDNKHKHFEEQEKDLLGNLDLKLDLVEQAESLVNSDQWKKTTETFHRLTNEWKTIGHTLNKKNEELWQRFIAAKSAFFDRKREHSERINQEQEVNAVKKAELVEKAEALKDSTDWNKTSIAFTELMEEWKKTGRVGGEKGDELWNRFTAAQDHFFTAKRAHVGEIKSMHEKNLELKRDLVQRAEKIKNSNHWGDATAEMNELLDEWKKIGPVAREYSNKIWEQFLAARKHFFARKDASRDQRRAHMDAVKAFRSAQAKEMVSKLLNDIRDEEEKLEDFKNALGNITPGKKAEELKTHLEALLADGEIKLKRLREKYEAVKEEYGRQAAKAEKETLAQQNGDTTEASAVTEVHQDAVVEPTASSSSAEDNTATKEPASE